MYKCNEAFSFTKDEYNTLVDTSMDWVIFSKLVSKTENVTFFGMGLFVIKNKSLFQIVFCFEKTFTSWIQD